MKPIVNINFKENIGLDTAEVIFENLSECLKDADCYLIATFEPVYEIKELNENQKILKFEGKFYTTKELEEILRKVAELNEQ